MKYVPLPPDCFRRPVLLLLSCCALTASGVVLYPPNESIDDFFVSNGQIYGFAETNNVVYVGGQFTSIGPRMGGAVPVSTVTGTPDSGYPRVSGTVSCIIADGVGGWFLGGSFSVVGNQIHTNLVHVRSDRSVDSGWVPAASGGSVECLYLSGGTLFVGGSFTNCNGQARNRVAALNAGSGTLLDWNPSANGKVSALVPYGGNVYLGGEFTLIGQQTRNYIGAVDAVSGAVTSWNPGTDGRVLALALYGARLLVGGQFVTLNSQSRQRLGSFDLSNGSLESWNPSIGSITIVQSIVYNLQVYQDKVFVAGQFSTVGAANRVNVAAVDLASGLATSWNANADYGYSGTIPIANIQGMGLYNNILYVSGMLYNIGGQPRTSTAALDVTTGAATSWNPNPNTYVLSFCGQGGSIYLGGLFSTINPLTRTNLAAYDVTSGQVTSWNPSAIGGPVWSLLNVGNRMYVAGEFTNLGGVSRSFVGSVDLASGAVSSWAPYPNLYAMTLARWNNRLYIGGAFTTYSGVSRTNLVEVDLSTDGLTSWNPLIYRGGVRTLAVSGNTLYAGGLFSYASGSSHARIAAFDLSAGGALTSWNPLITGSSVMESICPLNNIVYIGGRFSSIGSSFRTNFAALDSSTAAVLSMTAHCDQPVYTIAATTNLVFVGGYFGVINGQPRSCLAAIDATSGNLTDWMPNPDFFVQRLYINKGTLYPCGAFLRIGSEPALSIAAYPLSFTGVPVIAANSARKTSDGSFQFGLSAPGSAQATVYASTNLSNWSPLQPLTLVHGLGRFSEPIAPNVPRKVYRVSVP